MKTFILSYSKISPAVLDTIVSNAYNCMCSWIDINEEFFEFRVYGVTDLDELSDYLSEYA